MENKVHDPVVRLLLALSKSLNIPQKIIAEHLSVSQVTVSHWFRGRSSPRQIDRSRMIDLVRLIGRLERSGDLPVERSLSRTERANRLRELFGLK